MIALDTNIIVRLLVRDDEEQARTAYRLIADRSVSVTLAVLMETEWVLRAVYGFSKPRVLEAMKGLVGLERLAIDDPIGARNVFMAYEAGLSFADAVHLAQSSNARGFATFDMDIVTTSAKLNIFVPSFTPQMLEEKR